MNEIKEKAQELEKIKYELMTKDKLLDQKNIQNQNLQSMIRQIENAGKLEIQNIQKEKLGIKLEKMALKEELKIKNAQNQRQKKEKESHIEFLKDDLSNQQKKRMKEKQKLKEQMYEEVNSMEARKQVQIKQLKKTIQILQDQKKKAILMDFQYRKIKKAYKELKNGEKGECIIELLRENKELKEKLQNIQKNQDKEFQEIPCLNKLAKSQNYEAEEKNKALKRQNRQIEDLIRRNNLIIQEQKQKIRQNYLLKTGGENQRSKAIQLNDYLFTGDKEDILDDLIKEKNFLVETIERTKGKKIKKTRLLFSFPKFQHQKFHQFIDNEKDYVVIVRLANRMTIAAFSEEPLVQKVSNKGLGFLCSLTNKLAFFLRKNYEKVKLTTYQGTWIEFGNLELKISERGVESPMWGHYDYRCFDTREHKSRKVLFGEEKKSFQLDCYEVHQVFFEEILS